MENYTKGPLLGKGTFGEVLQGTHKEVRQHLEQGWGSILTAMLLISHTAFDRPDARVSPPMPGMYALPLQTGELVAIKKIRVGEKGEVRAYWGVAVSFPRGSSSFAVDLMP